MYKNTNNANYQDATTSPAIVQVLTEPSVQPQESNLFWYSYTMECYVGSGPVIQWHAHWKYAALGENTIIRKPWRVRTCFDKSVCMCVSMIHINMHIYKKKRTIIFKGTDWNCVNSLFWWLNYRYIFFFLLVITAFYSIAECKLKIF